LTCDSHFHVFGDPATSAYSAGRRNSLPALPPADYIAGRRDFSRQCVIKRMVFTQPGTWGQDNTCLFDAINMCGGMARCVAQ